jgi:hypothetical protein
MFTQSTSQQIELGAIERLVEYPRNPGKNDAAVDRMCASIREFGFKIPCLVRSDGEVALMSNLKRRLKKLEALLTDDAGLVAGSPKWLAYWMERAGKILNGDDEVRGCQIPLDVVDAILEASQRARS